MAQGGYKPDGSLRSVRDGAPPSIYVPLAQSSGMFPPDKNAISVTVRVAAGSPALVPRSVAAASIWLSRFVAPLVYGLEPRDPLTLAVASVVLAGVGAAAGWLPAQRASQVDPAVVLREGVIGSRNACAVRSSRCRARR